MICRFSRYHTIIGIICCNNAYCYRTNQNHLYIHLVPKEYFQFSILSCEYGIFSQIKKIMKAITKIITSVFTAAARELKCYTALTLPHQLSVRQYNAKHCRIDAEAFIISDQVDTLNEGTFSHCNR